ncbi:LytTR family DNA-binding domain-containing protein [Lacinutrix sp. Hel_I_90]|uniref:LytR/AlgR family response regulator transcription factor n=1 Tax=Lacinutrix sp. Hel_I_90 TaxID=1249999 RepID=UPI0005C8EC88|nr:LytTR family DNA-binding domain-containing protein [Lacinutrix sp. Hel_I_90]
MLRAIIVDDEQLSIDSLKWELSTHFSEIEVVFSTKSSNEAIKAINVFQPNLLFIDIQMPDMDGFQLLNQLEFRDFDIIFITAFDRYAIKALKVNATDYLLKPIDKEELGIAIKKVIKHQKEETLGENLKEILRNTRSNNDVKHSKIALHMEKKIILVEQKEILYCKSQGSYTYVFMHNGPKHLISKNLKQLFLSLDHNEFFRIHQSYLVNRKYIVEYYRGDGGEIILTNGKNLPVSRSKKNELLQHITN